MSQVPCNTVEGLAGRWSSMSGDMVRDNRASEPLLCGHGEAGLKISTEVAKHRYYKRWKLNE